MAAVMPLIGACSGDLSALDPAGPAGAAIARLWWTMFAASIVIFLVTGLVLLLAWAKPKALAGLLTPGNMIVWGGLAFPSVVLIALLLSAFILGERLMGAPASSTLLRIDVESRQWQWQFRYPSAAGALTTTDVVHIPAGQEVEFSVTSVDVIHSFWVPRLGGKIDAIPGHRNTIRLQADKPGRYGGVCAEFCGTGHGHMQFTVEAHRLADYERVLSSIGEARAQ